MKSRTASHAAIASRLDSDATRSDGTATTARPPRRAPPGSSPAPAPPGRPAASPRRSRPPRRGDARSCRARSTPACPRGSRTRSRPATVPGVVARPSAATITWASRSGSFVAASSHNHTPSANRGSNSAATCIARRVLPTPPTPVSVTSRDSSSAFATPATSSSRPTNDVNCTGKFPGNASSDRNGGKVSRTPGAPPGTLALGETSPADDAHPSRQGSPQRPNRRPRAHRSRATPAPDRHDRWPSTAPLGSPPGRSSRRPVPRPHRCAHPSAPAAAQPPRARAGPRSHTPTHRRRARTRSRTHRHQSRTRPLRDVRPPRAPTRHDAPGRSSSRRCLRPTDGSNSSMSVNRNVTVPDGA